MPAHLIQALITVLMKVLTPELVKKFADMTLDFVEEHVEGTKSSVDDMLVLPVCQMIRRSFEISD